MTRMDGATMSIVGTKIKPIIFVKVEVQPEHNQANIMVERVELDGSDAVRSAAGSFNGKDGPWRLTDYPPPPDTREVRRISHIRYVWSCARSLYTNAPIKLQVALLAAFGCRTQG